MIISTFKVRNCGCGTKNFFSKPYIKIRRNLNYEIQKIFFDTRILEITNKESKILMGPRSTK